MVCVINKTINKLIIHIVLIGTLLTRFDLGNYHTLGFLRRNKIIYEIFIRFCTL